MYALYTTGKNGGGGSESCHARPFPARNMRTTAHWRAHVGVIVDEEVPWEGELVQVSCF